MHSSRFSLPHFPDFLYGRNKIIGEKKRKFSAEVNKLFSRKKEKEKKNYLLEKNYLSINVPYWNFRRSRKNCIFFDYKFIDGKITKEKKKYFVNFKKWLLKPGEKYRSEKLDFPWFIKKDYPVIPGNGSIESSFLLGVAPTPKEFMSQTVCYYDDVIQKRKIGLISECKDPYWKEVDYDLTEFSVNPGFETYRPQLQSHFDYLDSEVTLDDLSSACSTLFKKYDFSRLRTPNDVDFNLQKVRFKTSPGVPMKYFQVSKAECVSLLEKKSKRLFSRILKEKFFDRSVYSLGGRVRKKTDSEEGPLKSRPIMVQSQEVVMACKPWSQAIEDSWKGRLDLPFCYGDNHQSMIPYKLKKKKKKFKYFIELDYSSFDSSVSSKMCYMAFSFLRSLFNHKDKRVENAFHFISSTMISKNLLFPDRSVFRCEGSIPSGNVFTSLVGSVVNLMMITIFCEKFLKGRKIGLMEWDVHVQSDDTLLYFNCTSDDFLKEDGFEEEVKKFFLDQFGVKISDFKKGRSEPSLQDEDGGTFLKTSISEGFPNFPYRLLIKSILFKEISRYSESELGFRSRIGSMEELNLFSIKSRYLYSLFEIENFRSSTENLSDARLFLRKSMEDSRIRTGVRYIKGLFNLDFENILKRNKNSSEVKPLCSLIGNLNHVIDIEKIKDIKDILDTERDEYDPYKYYEGLYEKTEKYKEEKYKKCFKYNPAYDSFLNKNGLLLLRKGYKYYVSKVKGNKCIKI